MNYYIDKLFIYCLYCLQTKNLHYETLSDNNNFYHDPINYMNKDKFDEDFLII